MADYKIMTLPAVRDQIDNIDSAELRQKIDAKISQLATNPHKAPGCKKLSASSKPNTYRTRQNNYRIIFTINKRDRVVSIIRVAPRPVAYKNI